MAEKNDSQEQRVGDSEAFGRNGGSKELERWRAEIPGGFIQLKRLERFRKKLLAEFPNADPTKETLR